MSRSNQSQHLDNDPHFLRFLSGAKQLILARAERDAKQLKETAKHTEVSA